MTCARRAALLAVAAIAAGGCGDGPADSTDSPRLPPIVAVDHPSCSPVTYGGQGSARVLVAMSTLLQGVYAETHGLPAANAVKLVLAQRRWRAGRHTVALQICDETSAESGLSDRGTCIRNARAFARARSVAVVLGPYFSGCAAAMLAIANRAPDGPLAVVSGANTYLGLTRAGPGVEDGEPARHHPTGRRSYVRVVPADDAQAAAAAIRARELGVERPFALHHGEAYGIGLASAFKSSAEASGLDVAGVAPWKPAATGYAALARSVRAAGADGAFLAGYHTDNGPRLIADLKRVLGRDFRILSSDGFADAEPLVEGAGSRADGVAIMAAIFPPRALPPAGRRFAEDYERRFGQRPCCYAVQFAQAAHVVLDAIGRSDGTRSGIADALFDTEVRDGLLGDFRIDRYGDTSSQTVGVYEIRGGRLEFLQKITPPPELLARE